MQKKSSKIAVATLIAVIHLLLFSTCTKDPPITPPFIQTQITPLVITVSIYPNPCHGSFTIQTNAPSSQRVKMYDVLGRNVLNQIINSSTNINVTSLPNGMYYIKITSTADSTSTFMRRLIIQ